MNHLLKKQLRRFYFAASGIMYAVRNDTNFKVQWYVGIAIVSIILYTLQPLSQTELTLLIGSYILILITELQNSALESALDHLHPELHHNIGKSKDMAAGAVLLAGIFMAIVIAILIATRL